MYIIACKSNGLMSYYTQGIHIENIPFERTTVVALFKTTWRNRKLFQKNLLPVFEQFQRACSLWFKAHRSSRYLLQRETGLKGGAPHPFVNYYRQTYKPPPYFSEKIQGF